MTQISPNSWALILGASSGMGLATAHKLGQQGWNLCLVHRDRRGAMPRINAQFDAIRASGVKVFALNIDALTRDNRHDILNQLQTQFSGGSLRLFLHSIALGNLRPLVAPALSPESGNPAILDEDDFAQTIAAMGSNLVAWVQDIHARGLFANDARVIGLTSEGNQIAWPGYAAVSAAKTTLEACARSIALEFAPHGIRCNIIQAGVTDTPALRLIPDHEQILERARLRNPSGRLTRPEDVANAVYLLSLPEAAWINGAILRVDGGEAISHS